MRRSLQNTTFIACVLGLLSSPIRAATPARVALVIGNSTYVAAGTLANPAADARLVADSLHRAGFTDVTLQFDLTKQEFEKALRTFEQKADGAEVALVYYAGHGLEADGRNWLVPVDATLADQRDLPFQGIGLDVVLGTVAGAKGLRMVVLDACRDNPFTRSMRRLSGTRGIAERGLADIEVTGTLVFYAQRAGQTAMDGTNGAADSPFATAFAARIPEKGVDIRILISEVRDDVLASTDNQQEPFSYGSLPGMALELVPATTGSATRPDPELQAFNEAVTRNSAEGWEAFLKAHPAGRYATLARSQRDVIRARAASPSSTPLHDLVGTQSAASNTPARPVVRDENASLQTEFDGDNKMYDAISLAACLSTNCLNFSADERQRQAAQALRDCVAAKKQWKSALETTTSPQRATALRPKIDGDAIQCRKGDTCVNTAASGYWYEYFSPTINDYVRAGNFHCSASDAVAAPPRERPPPQSAARDDNASRQDEYDGDAKMYEAISIAACVSKNCLSYSAEERRQQAALARRDCILGKKLWRSALDKATSPDRAIALATKINGDALQCNGGSCVKTAASGYWYEYYVPALSAFEKAPDFHCSESDPL